MHLLDLRLCLLFTVSIPASCHHFKQSYNQCYLYTTWPWTFWAENWHSVHWLLPPWGTLTPILGFLCQFSVKRPRGLDWQMGGWTSIKVEASQCQTRQPTDRLI